MSTTVVGIFDERDEAEQACKRLEGLGVDMQSVRMESSGTEIDSEIARGRRGFFARLFGLGDDDDSSGTYAEAVRRGGVVVSVIATDDAQADQVQDVMEECGAIDIDERVEQWRAGGYAGHDESAPAYTPEQIADERGKLQVVEEELEVGKRQVDRGGVRVRRHVTERPVEERVTLREERAVVDRQPADRQASAAELQDAFREQTVEVRETAEEPVITKTARVVEEVTVGKQATEREQRVRDTVRRSDVDVEPIEGGSTRRANREVEEHAMASPTTYTGEERRSERGGYEGPERRSRRTQ